jgi:uncharacterized protein YjiK
MSAAPNWLYALLLPVACLGSGNADADNHSPGARSGHTLSIAARHLIPVREVSGLALVQRDAQAFEIYAVGDSSFGIGRVALEEPAGSPNIDAVDATRPFGGKAEEASQWEAVATDGRGGLCVQAEVTSRVSCLGEDLRTLSVSFTLDPSSVKGLGKLWDNDANSRGEGMILMKRGHLLLLKEKRPSLLVEFGPAGEAPIGYGRDTFLDPGEEFIKPMQDRLVALKVWRFSDLLASMAKDASDLTVGPDGRVYLLSDESAIVIRLEQRLKPEQERVHASAAWKLPAEIVKPEGLVIDKAMHPWVAVDSKDKDRPNLFRMMPIASP